MLLDKTLMVCRRLSRALAAAVLAGACAAGTATQVRTNLPAGDYTPAEPNEIVLTPEQAPLRDEALRRARVWREPAQPIAAYAFDRNPPAPWSDPDEIVCRFLPAEPRGTTGKFDCVLPGGQAVKVKYQRSGEIPGEVAATRLLRAIGFGADEMHLARRVRCFGCPKSPFVTMKVLDWVALRERYEKRIDYGEYSDFTWVAVERRFDAPELKVEDQRGWHWHELKTPESGGAARIHLDGFRVIAMLLNHWDNKGENQRLVCLGGWSDASGCVDPFAFIQDAGSTFGPSKVTYDTWRRTRIWADEARCLVSMKSLPYNGATFEDVTVTEEGRRWIAARLAAISDRQLADLFGAARFPEHERAWDRDGALKRWVAAFKDKVKQIADRPPCPPA